MNSQIKKLFVISALLASQSPSFADVKYHYSGHTATNSEATSAYPYVPLHAPMTFDFTVASPLAANLANVNILPSVLSWSATGGTLLSTITSADPNPYTSLGPGWIRISTDASGYITTYSIVVQASVAVQPDTEAQFQFARTQITSTQAGETFYGYSISHDGGPFVAASCPGFGACDGPTSFGISSAVPEPAVWALLLSGAAFLSSASRLKRAGSIAPCA